MSWTDWLLLALSVVNIASLIFNGLVWIEMRPKWAQHHQRTTRTPKGGWWHPYPKGWSTPTTPTWPPHDMGSSGLPRRADLDRTQSAWDATLHGHLKNEDEDPEESSEDHAEAPASSNAGRASFIALPIPLLNQPLGHAIRVLTCTKCTHRVTCDPGEIVYWGDRRLCIHYGGRVITDPLDPATQ